MHPRSEGFRLRRWLPTGLLLVLGVLLAACAQVERTQIAPTMEAVPASGDTYVPVLAASTLEVGPNRLPLGIVQNGTPVNDPDLKPHLRFYYLDAEDNTRVRSEMDAVYRGEGLPLGVYVAYPTLDQAGAWGIEVEIPRPGGAPSVSRIRVSVLESSGIPAVGDAALPSENLTIADVPELQQLTSDSQPDPELYQMTIADALAARKPFLLTFATPGFCQTAVCAPNIQVVKRLKQSFGEQVNFLHIEVYPYPFGESFQQQRLVPVMTEWNLRTEPWTFLVDAQGIIQARYEGGITLAELEPALRQLAAGEPVTPVLADVTDL